MRPAPALAVLAALVLAATSLVACSGGAQQATATVGRAGGRVGPTSRLAQVDVPAGAVADGTKITFGTGSPTKEDLAGLALPVGDAVNIKPSARLTGASVRMPFDPGKDLPNRHGTKATTANAFIAVYDPTVGGWVPLETTFDQATGQLVAFAPHFSWFRRYVVDPLSKAWSAAATGLEAAVSFALDTAQAAGGALWTMVNGEQKEIDCPAQPSDWTVTSPVSEVRGCVAPNADGSRALRLRSTQRLPYMVTVPAPVSNPHGGYVTDLGPLDLLAHFTDAAIGQVYVPARGRAELTVPAGTNRVQLHFQPDQLALAIKAVLTMINIIPDAAVFKEELFARASVRAKMVELADDHVTVHEFFAQLTVVIEREIEVDQKEGALKVVPMVADALECVTGAIHPADDGTEVSTESLIAASVTLAKKCLSTAIASWDQLNPTNEIGDLVGVLAAVPDGIQFLGTLWDSIRMAVLHFGAQFDVTATRPGAELSALPDTELRPDGGITCPPPGPEQLPGATGTVRCRWVVHLDLDGNGKPDAIVLWRTDTGRGAVAVTDDGSTHALSATPQLEQGNTERWSEGLQAPDEFPYYLDTATPQAILHATGGRDLLAVAAYQGGRGDDVWVLGLDTAGGFAFVAYGNDTATAFTYSSAGDVPTCLTAQVTFAPPLRATC